MFLPTSAAVLGILAFLPFKFSYLFGFIFLVPLFLFFLKEEKLWRLLAGAALFRVAFALGVVYYTFEPITWFFSVLIFLGLPVSVFLLKKIARRPEIILATLPFLWTIWDILEARYSFLPTYVMTLGNAFGASAFVGLAGFGGLTSLIFFGAVINALLAYFILKLKEGNKKSVVRPVVLTAVILFSGWGLSQLQLQKNYSNYQKLTNSLKVAVVSADENFRSTDLGALENELKKEKSDLIILPEDLLDYSGQPSEENQMFSISGGLAKNLNTPVIASFDTFQNNKRYNSDLLFNESGGVAASRSKYRLTFIGEYWPFGKWYPFFFNWALETSPGFKNYAVFNPANPYFRGEKNLLSFEKNGRKILLAAPICIEIYYPEDLWEYKKAGAEMIINPGSNRWVELGIGHYLYLANNFRKIESVSLELPVIISGVKDSAGVILSDGEMRSVDYKKGNQRFNVLREEVKF